MVGTAVMSMYTGAKTVVRTVYGNSSGFEVKVGMHQGSALSPLLFVIVKEAICREFRVAFYHILSLTFQNMDPLHFQAGGRRRRPNLGLVCFVLMFTVFLVKDACLFSSCLFSFSLVMR